MIRLLAALMGTILLVATGAAAAEGRMLSRKEVKDLLAKATTPQDHRKLAGHFEAKAKRYEEEAAEHAEMAKVLRTRPSVAEGKRPGAVDTVAHCDMVVQSLTKAATEARAMAAMHEAAAKK